MSSSELNDFRLNTDRVVRLGQIVLDVRALNTSAVGGKSAYDAGDLTYNSTVSTYDGTLINFATGSSAFGGLNAAVQSTPVVIVSANSQFGAITSAANSNVTHFASANSPISELQASAISNISNSVSASAQFGAIVASATTEISHSATANANLGALDVAANTLPVILPLFNAILGDLNANANATVVPAPKPAPESQYGAARPYPAPQVTTEPAFKQPKTPKIEETPKAQEVKLPKTIVAKAYTNKSSFSSNAAAQVEWSILEDEAELLLLL